MGDRYKPKRNDHFLSGILEENWGGRWWRGTWPLACPSCGRRDRLFERWQQKIACSRCVIEFVASPAALPTDRIPIPIWVLAVYLLTHGASARQLAILEVSHKTALRIARFVRDRAGIETPITRVMSCSDVMKLLSQLWTRRLLESPALMRSTTVVFWDMRQPK